MDNLKNTFRKGITTLNVKTNNFMEESKCKTYITTLENTIRELKYKLGDTVYTKWSKDENPIDDISELLEEIRGKYLEIEIQKERIQQLLQNEQQILGKTQGQVSEKAGTMLCPQCGMQNADNYKFCISCGTALR